MENNRSCSDKSLVSPLPVPPHLIRSARRRDSTARRTGRTKLTANLVEELGERREESNGTPDGEENGERKSCDDFYRISRYYSSGGGDYGCPALSPRGGGFASSSSFSFSSFLVLALDCYLPPPLRAKRWRLLLPIPECSDRHCRKYVFCRSDLAEYVGREPVPVDVYSGEHVEVVPLDDMPSRLGEDEGTSGDIAWLQVESEVEPCHARGDATDVEGWRPDPLHV